MQMDRPPEPPAGAEPSRDGPPPADRRGAPVTSIQQFESPHAAEATMADQRSADPATTEPPRETARGVQSGSALQEGARGSAPVPGTGPAARPESARGTARVRPVPGSGVDGGRPAGAGTHKTAGGPAPPRGAPP